MKDNPSVIREVKMVTSVPLDGDLAIYQFTTRKKHLTQWGDGYARISNDGFLVMAASDLTSKDFKVLSLLLRYCEFENIVKVSQSVIAKDLATQQTSISQSVKKLISIDFLKIIDTDGRKNIYMFNPEYVLKSKGKNLVDLLIKYGHHERPVDAGNET